MAPGTNTEPTETTEYCSVSAGSVRSVFSAALHEVAT